jgi:hypothetical protein
MIQKINFKDNSRQTNAYDGYEVTPINNNNQAYLNETSNNLGLQQNNVYPNQTIPINNMNQMNMMGNFGGLMGLGQKSANPFIIDPRRFTYNGN